MLGARGGEGKGNKGEQPDEEVGGRGVWREKGGKRAAGERAGCVMNWTAAALGTWTSVLERFHNGLNVTTQAGAGVLPCHSVRGSVKAGDRNHWCVAVLTRVVQIPQSSVSPPLASSSGDLGTEETFLQSPTFWW